jgi:hypothetical protein
MFDIFSGNFVQGNELYDEQLTFYGGTMPFTMRGGRPQTKSWWSTEHLIPRNISRRSFCLKYNKAREAGKNADELNKLHNELAGAAQQFATDLNPLTVSHASNNSIRYVYAFTDHNRVYTTECSIWGNKHHNETAFKKDRRGTTNGSCNPMDWRRNEFKPGRLSPDDRLLSKLVDRGEPQSVVYSDRVNRNGERERLIALNRPAAQKRAARAALHAATTYNFPLGWTIRPDALYQWCLIPVSAYDFVWACKAWVNYRCLPDYHTLLYPVLKEAFEGEEYTYLCSKTDHPAVKTAFGKILGLSKEPHIKQLFDNTIQSIKDKPFPYKTTTLEPFASAFSSTEAWNEYFNPILNDLNTLYGTLFPGFKLKQWQAKQPQPPRRRRRRRGGRSKPGPKAKPKAYTAVKEEFNQLSLGCIHKQFTQ